MKRDKYRMINWEDIFVYDESSRSGLRWKIQPSYRVKAGDIVGTSSERAWEVIYLGKKYKCHVIIFSMFYELVDGCVIDHIDRNCHNNKIENLRQIEAAKNQRNKNKSRKNTSGKTGVTYKPERTIVVGGYYAATWNDMNGKRNNKRFHISTYGKNMAFRLACEYRDKMLAELNKQGAGYTETHGQ